MTRCFSLERSPENLRALAEVEAGKQWASLEEVAKTNAILYSTLAAALERIAVLEDEVSEMRGRPVGESPLIGRIEALEANCANLPKTTAARVEVSGGARAEGSTHWCTCGAANPFFSTRCHACRGQLGNGL